VVGVWWERYIVVENSRCAVVEVWWAMYAVVNVCGG